ncbi:MAG: AAA family ATPase [Chitinophagaceae bacterium]|nr:MAG: AAA family ATPase [Chitinophagaceae bacterium]
MIYIYAIILLIVFRKRISTSLGNAAVAIARRFRKQPELRDYDWIDLNPYYMHRFGRVPCLIHVYQLDSAGVWGHLNLDYKTDIVDLLQNSTFNADRGVVEFDTSILVLRYGIIVELCGGSVTIAYTEDVYGKAAQLAKELAVYKQEPKAQQFEMNVIRYTPNGLVLKPIEVKPTDLDIGLYYNDDFADVNRVILERLATPGDKGIVLLHGLPGTGKTTYLRYVLGKISKKVLFVSASVAENLMDPCFMDLLLDNPDSLLVIEDAESVMMDRQLNRGSSVSNLLNLSDGLVSDCISVQVICTFNSQLSLIDPALLRKGRMIARYEFGKLTTDKAGKLSAHLGFTNEVNQPMTLAEVTTQEQASFETNKKTVIGFRRQEVMEN